MSLRRKNNYLLHRNGAVSFEEDTNPLETVANLSDIMLVFAVALMLIIVMRYNIDLSDAVQIDTDKLEPVDQAQTTGGASEQQTGQYEEVGKVYRDISSGELYVVKDTQ